MSAIAEHTVHNNHSRAWEDADSHHCLPQQCTLEAWHIHKQPRPVNREKEAFSLKSMIPSLDPNQLDLPDLPSLTNPHLLTRTILSSGIPFYLLLTSGIECAVSYMQTHNNVGASESPSEIGSFTMS